MCEHLNSKKSNIAREVLEKVVMLFKTSEYAGNAEKIQEYCRWAMQEDGPAFYLEPTPQYCDLDSDDENRPVSVSFR